MQNCSGPKFSGYGPSNHSRCNYGHGGGGDCYGDSGFIRDHIGFIEFDKSYTGTDPPSGLPKITPAHIIFGPGPGLGDEKWGTQDPQCAFDGHTSQYFLSYTAWAGPSVGWAQKAAGACEACVRDDPACLSLVAGSDDSFLLIPWHSPMHTVSTHPADPNSWKRLGFTFQANNSWPTSAKGAESNIKCSALYTVPVRYIGYINYIVVRATYCRPPSLPPWLPACRNLHLRSPFRTRCHPVSRAISSTLVT